MDFLTYDRLYRQHRAAENPKLDWSVTRQTIYNKIVLLKSAKSSEKKPGFRQQFKQKWQKPESNSQTRAVDQGSAGFIPWGYCYDFHNRGRFCPPDRACTYNHDCPHCGKGIHPAHICRFKPIKLQGYQEQSSYQQQQPRHYTQPQQQNTQGPQYTNSNANNNTPKPQSKPNNAYQNKWVVAVVVGLSQKRLHNQRFSRGFWCWLVWWWTTTMWKKFKVCRIAPGYNRATNF